MWTSNFLWWGRIIGVVFNTSTLLWFLSLTAVCNFQNLKNSIIFKIVTIVFYANLNAVILLFCKASVERLKTFVTIPKTICAVQIEIP